MKKIFCFLLFSFIIFSCINTQAAFVIKNETPATTENKIETVEITTHKNLKEKIIEKIAIAKSNKLIKKLGLSPTENTTPKSEVINKLAIAGATCSLLGVLALTISGIAFFGFLACIAGFILSILGLGQAKKRHELGKGLAIAGIVLGSIPLLLILLVLMSVATFNF